MNDLLDSGSMRFAAYLLATVVALAWGWREQRHPDRGMRQWWPAYWWTSSALLGAMTIARASELGDLIGDFGREQAHSAGWYDGRRVVQAVAVLVIGCAWLLGVLIAVWRVPPRRRRYLPHAVGVSGLAAFAAVRIISLHQVDALLYRRHVADVRVVALVELALLTATISLGLIGARFPRADAPRTDDAGAVDPSGRRSESANSQQRS